MKYTLRAVIPTTQYGNLQPEIEVEADTFAEAHAQAMPHIQEVWDTYGEKPLTARKATGYVRLCSDPQFGEAWFRESDHQYKNKAGKTLLSASQYTDRYKLDFPKDAILPAMAKKYGLEASTIAETWDMKNKVSQDFGHAIHTALEFHGKHKDLMNQIEAVREKEAKDKKKDYARRDDFSSVINGLVQAFYKGRDKEEAMYEVLVTHGLMVGQIDRLLIVDKKKKICRVQDYKTRPTLDDGTTAKMKAPYNGLKDIPLNHYRLQLSYYAEILEKLGWTVEGLDIFHLDAGEWKTIEVERVKLV